MADKHDAPTAGSVGADAEHYDFDENALFTQLVGSSVKLLEQEQQQPDSEAQSEQHDLQRAIEEALNDQTTSERAQEHHHEESEQDEQDDQVDHRGLEKDTVEPSLEQAISDALQAHFDTEEVTPQQTGPVVHDEANEPNEANEQIEPHSPRDEANDAQSELQQAISNALRETEQTMEASEAVESQNVASVKPTQPTEENHYDIQGEDILAQLELNSAIEAALKDSHEEPPKKTPAQEQPVDESDLELSKAIAAAIGFQMENKQPGEQPGEQPEHPPHPENSDLITDAADIDLSMAIANAFKDAQQTSSKNFGESTSSSSSSSSYPPLPPAPPLHLSVAPSSSSATSATSASGSLPAPPVEDELQAALAQMVQTVVDTKLFPTAQQPAEPKGKKAAAKPKKAAAKPKPRKSTKKTKKADSDLDQFHWNEMMEKAMEMAMENPEHLISTMNLASAPGALSKTKEQTTARARKTSASRQTAKNLASTMASAAMTTAAVKAAAQQRLAQVTAQQQAKALLAQQQRDRELRQKLEREKEQAEKAKQASAKAAPLPANMLQFTVPTPPTSIPAPKTSKPQPTATSQTISAGEFKPTPPILEQFQKFQKPTPVSDLSSVKPGESINKGLSIAESLAIQREKMVKLGNESGNRPVVGFGPVTGITKKSEGSFLKTILGSLNFANLNSTLILNSIAPQTMNSIKETVSKTVAGLVGPTTVDHGPSLTQNLKSDTDKSIPSSIVDEKERIRQENRERKKRWRVINIERNRDNDLRARVIKRANQIFPNPDDEELRKKWITEEFEKRKRKRLVKNASDKIGKGGIGGDDTGSASPTGSDDFNVDDVKGKFYYSSSPVTEILSDPQVSETITQLYRAVNGGEEDNSASSSKVSNITSTATALTAAYVATNRSISETSIPTIVSSLVTSLNSLLIGSGVSAGDKMSHMISSPAGTRNSGSARSGLPSGTVTSFRVNTPHGTPSSATLKTTLKPPTLHPDMLLTSFVKNTKKAANEQYNSSLAAFKTLSLRVNNGPNLNLEKVVPEKRMATVTGQQLDSKKPRITSIEIGKTSANAIDLELDDQINKFSRPTSDQNEAEKSEVSGAPKPRAVGKSSARPSSSPPPSIPQVKLPQYLKPETTGIKTSNTSPVVRSIVSPQPTRSNSPVPSAGPIGLTRPSAKGIGSSARTQSQPGHGIVGLRKPGAFRKPPGFGITAVPGENGKKPFGNITPITPLKKE